VSSKTGQVHGIWFLIGSYAYLFSETPVQFVRDYYGSQIII